MVRYQLCLTVALSNGCFAITDGDSGLPKQLLHPTVAYCPHLEDKRVK